MAETRKYGHEGMSDLPEGFKMTEMGPLPEEWEVVRLGEVVKKARSGGTPLRSKKEYWNGSIPFALIEDLTASGLYLYRTKESISEEGLRNSSAWIVPEGSILLSMYATIGATAVNKIPLATNQAILALVPTENLNAEFGALLLSYKADELARFNVQSTQKNINKGIVLRFFIPLPPLSEQRAIAHVLRTVQRAKEATERVIQATRELKKSLMRYLFTYGPVPMEEAERVPLKETEIGLVPEHWEVVRLGEVATVKYGKARPKTQGNVPVIGSGGIYGWTATSLVDFPTLVIGRKGTAGEVWLVECPCWPSDTTFYLDWKKRVNVRFLFNYLHSNKPSGEHAKTTLPSLQRHDVEALLIPFPPLLEQGEICLILRAVDKKLQAEEARKQALEALFKSLLNNLMTGKIRVKDVVLPNVGEGKGDVTH